MSKEKITQKLKNVSGGKSDEFEVHKNFSKTYQEVDPDDPEGGTTTVTLSANINVTKKVNDNSKVYNFEGNHDGDFSF